VYLFEKELRASVRSILGGAKFEIKDFIDDKEFIAVQTEDDTDYWAFI